MKPVRFEECNFTLAERQPEYQPLPAHWHPETAVITTCWQFDEEEKRLVQEHGLIFIQQMTFKHPLQPQLPTVLNPLTNQPGVIQVQHEEVLRRERDQYLELLLAVKPPDSCPFCTKIDVCTTCRVLAETQGFIRGKLNGIESRTR